MRPEILFPLFAPVRTLPGVGPRSVEKFARIAGERVIDLLWLRPNGYVDRRLRPSIAAVPEGTIGTVEVNVLSHIKPARPKAPYRVLCGDEASVLELARKLGIHPAIVAGRLRFERRDYRMFPGLIGIGQVRSLIFGD